MFPKKLPPFLLRRGCGGQVGLVIHSACATDDTFRGPRSTVFRAAPPYSHLRERHCLYFSQKLPPPSSFAEAAEDKSGLSSTALARRMILFGAPLSEEIVPDTACRARLKRPCPTLRVVLVSKDHARHCVSCSSPVSRAAPPYSHLRERHCLLFYKKRPPFGHGPRIGEALPIFRRYQYAITFRFLCKQDITSRGPGQARHLRLSEKENANIDLFS